MDRISEEDRLSLRLLQGAHREAQMQVMLAAKDMEIAKVNLANKYDCHGGNIDADSGVITRPAKAEAG